MLGGPPGKIDKNGAIWCILGVPKFVIMDLNSIDFKDNNSTTTKIIRHSFRQYKSHMHVSTKVNIFTLYKGVCGQ